MLPRRTPRFRHGDSVPGALAYKFVELLGAGGFGEVWLAHDPFMEQFRAFKFCLDRQSRERLLTHEGQVVKRVMAASRDFRDDDHGIVPLGGAYLEGESPWLAYEYIDGGDLSSVARELVQLAPTVRGARAVEILTDLATVVGRCHSMPQPLIHRDLKPANILVKQLGERWLLRITDFGISHIAADRSVNRGSVSTPSMHLGETFRGAHTPIYASPQLNAKNM